MYQVVEALEEWMPRWTVTAAELVRTGLWLPIEVHNGLQPKEKIDDDAFISGSFMNLDGKVFTRAHSSQRRPRTAPRCIPTRLGRLACSASAGVRRAAFL